ncbi:MAG: zinc-ribbon domain-containing protein [Ruminococcus sp.]|nr:zinc-ribbon domain-containing protein [Ruminococcus sp.]
MICSKCGSQIPDNSSFCNVCGAEIDNAAPAGIIPDIRQSFQQGGQVQPNGFAGFDPNAQMQNMNNAAQPQMPDNPMGAQAAGMPVQSQGGSRKKLIIIISAIAAAVAVVLLILFLFVFKSKKDLIVGTWQESRNGTYTRFNKDGTVELVLGNDQTKAVYEIDGDSLIIKRDSISLNYKIDELTEDKMTLSASAGLQTESVSFTKVNEDAAVKSYTEKSKLKTANSNAKLVFTTLNNEAADRIADGESVAAVHTGGAVAAADLEDSSDPLLKAVYKALKDNGGELGYIYIEFDPNDYESTGFVQWSASESGGLIGQYPNAVKTVEESEGMTFGQKN